MRSYEHDREATDLCLALEGAFPHHQVLTEREIRSHDAGAEQPAYSLAEQGQGFARRRHSPNFAVAGWDPDGGHLLVELERTVKGRARLERIIDLYAKSELRADFATVLYVVSDDDTERAMSAAIAAVRERMFDSPPPVCQLRRAPGEPLELAPLYEFQESRWDRGR